MSKNQYRTLIVLSLAIGLLSGVYDYIWPDPITDQVFDYIVEIEPEIDGTKLVVAGALAVLAIIMALVSVVGLLLFKSWARHVYAAGFVAAFALYPFMGVTVYSGFSQVLYDISMVLSGVLLALMYYSPVARHYEKKI
ncbi:hypothetical protein [Microbulbifer sp. PSTR4-B]|uniref:hypothetical protein n=1 Tax=Microbulbifer sp. PSTR4-B TaxID=3243396 RepID=UPI0040398196